MRNEYGGRTAKFTIGNETYYARFEEDDLTKNIYGDKKSSPNGWKAKINTGASGDIFELVENARYYGSKSETGKEAVVHQGVQNWDYFVKQVQIDGRVYDLVSNVSKRTDGEYVYSVQLNDNKKIKVSPPVAINDSISMGAQHSTNNIPNPAENVNSKSQKNEKRFALDERYQKEYADDNGISTIDIMRDLGYDGILDGAEVVVFSPEQVKSVDNESPTSNPDIRYSLDDGRDGECKRRAFAFRAA